MGFPLVACWRWILPMHADDFRAVISVEGALKIEGSLEHFAELWHPQVNNEYKARLMDGLMSPAS